jgi:uncharacterized protein YaiI (UPF0178 family)
VNILVDADACPVKQIIVKVAKEKNIHVIMFIDTSHVIDDGYSEVVIVDKARDSVDFALVNKVQKGDVVVTQDYGVAAMTLARGAVAINQNGLIYSEENMNKLLFERHLSQKMRRSGNRVSGPSKRTKEQDEKFYFAFRQLISNMLLQIDV